MVYFKEAGALLDMKSLIRKHRISTVYGYVPFPDGACLAPFVSISPGQCYGFEPRSAVEKAVVQNMATVRKAKCYWSVGVKGKVVTPKGLVIMTITELCTQYGRDLHIP